MRVFYLVLSSCFLFVAGCGGGSSESDSAPVASAATFTVLPGGILEETLRASDADGDSLSFRLVEPTASGLIELLDASTGRFEYRPDQGFTGEDQFRFHVSDGKSTSDDVLVTIQVNTAPTIEVTSYETNELGPLKGEVIGRDADGDSLTFEIVERPQKGELTKFDTETGLFTYIPDTSQDGIDSFRVTASDGVEKTEPATVGINIFQWQAPKLFGTPESDFPSTGGMIRDAEGNITFGGATSGQLTGEWSGNGQHSFLRRLDRRGNEVWMQEFADIENNINDLFYAARIVEGVPGSEDFIVTESESSAVYRFDKNGVQLWRTVIDFGDINFWVGNYWGGVDPSGDVYVISWFFAGEASDVGSRIAKISGVSGDILWTRTLFSETIDPESPWIPDSQWITVRGIDFDAKGNTILVGNYEHSESSTTLSPCFRCGFIASLDTDGNDQWLVRPEAQSAACGVMRNEQLNRVAVDSVGDIYVVGNVNRDIEGVDYVEGSINKFSADGQERLWSYCLQAPSTLFTNPLLSADGDLVAYGTSYERRVEAEDVADLVMLRFSDTGDLLFRERLDINNQNGEPANTQAGSIVEDEQGFFYVTASSDGVIDGEISSGGDDMLLLRLNADGSLAQ